MSLSEEREILLSQLVDHELPADQTVQVLLEALENAESSQQLKAMLRLRQVLEPWRRQEPPRALVALPPARPLATFSHPAWRPLSLAAAAVLGGVLVACGFYLGGRLGSDRSIVALNPPAVETHPQPGPTPAPPQPVILVTPEQRSEIARAFALHESVAGPLSWYAADESTIQVAPVEAGEKAEQPIAVVLRLQSAGGCPSNENKTYMIVCRNNNPAVIELPRLSAVRSAHLRLVSTVTPKGVSLQYALAADASHGAPGQGAALVGRRQLGLAQVPLGQLTLNDCLLSVDASAWALRDAGRNQ